MKQFAILALVGIFVSGCARHRVFSDDDMGNISRVFKSVTFSPIHKQDPAFRDTLTFVRVEPSGEVVMTFTVDGKYEIRGKPGEVLSSVEMQHLPLNVWQTSYQNQTADIEYEAWTSRKKE
jgi:hypothetical protein